jgi:hypothetical protein
MYVILIGYRLDQTPRATEQGLHCPLGDAILVQTMRKAYNESVNGLSSNIAELTAFQCGLKNRSILETA